MRKAEERRRKQAENCHSAHLSEKPMKQCLTAVLVPAPVSLSAKRLLLPGDLEFGLQRSPVHSDKLVQVLPRSGSDKSQGTVCWTEVSDAVVLPG